MLAFYEAVLAYERNRGAFLPYAARAIRNRLIDHYRTEKRHGNVISLHTPLGGEEDGGELLDTIPDTVDHTEDYAVRTASRREIQEFSEKLPSSADLLRRGGQLPPAGADLRRLPPGAGLRPDPAGAAQAGGGHGQAAHGGAVRRLRHRQEDHGAAPEVPGAILLAFTNGYEIIRGHLCQVGPKRGGDEA